MRNITDLPWPDVAKVHQAEGVLIARLDLSSDEAARLLRAYADEADVGLLEIALDVLAPLSADSPGTDGHEGNASP